VIFVASLNGLGICFAYLRLRSFSNPTPSRMCGAYAILKVQPDAQNFGGVATCELRLHFRSSLSLISYDHQKHCIALRL